VHTARGLPAISRGRGRAFIRAHAVEWILSMHQAAIFEFERAAREFARWRAVPEAERSPAPGWWWGPAFTVRTEQQQMPAHWCARLELPSLSTYAAGAAVLMHALSDQTSLPWPDEFPRKPHRDADITVPGQGKPPT
jgi:hypothetical protein